MDEVFGEKNIIEQLIWKCRAGGGGDSKFFSNDHEYILAYAKNIDNLDKFYTDYTDEQLKKFQSEDEKGKYFIKTLERPEALGKRPNLQYPITAPDWSIIHNKREGIAYTWVISEPEFIKYKEKGLIEFKQNNNKWMVYRKYHMELEDGEARQTKPRSILDKIALTANGGKELKSLFDSGNWNSVFDNPKPVELIKFLLKIVTNENSIVLDSFAWSGTTAQAVMELNEKDWGNRKFILVQLPETLTEKAQAKLAGYDFVHEITRDRIKKVIERDNLTIGFTYYQLGPSIEARKILEGESLPSWESFAKYVHFLATGKPLDTISLPDTTWEIKTTAKGSGIYLIYRDSLEKLKNLAITREWLETVKDIEGKKTVYAPACFLDKEVLDEYQISFVQVPYNLFQRS